MDPDSKSISSQPPSKSKANKQVLRRLPYVIGAFAAMGMIMLISTNMKSERKDPPEIAGSYTPWSKEIVEAFELIPVLEGGRIKPMETFARFKLLKLHGKRSIKLKFSEQDELVKLSPAEWMLDCLFKPKLAVKYPLFIVDNDDVIIDLGMEEHEKKRSRYSYEEIEVARAKLFQKRNELAKIETKDKTTEQLMMANLASNVNDFEFLFHNLDFAHVGAPLELEEGTEELTKTPISEVLADKETVFKKVGDRRSGLDRYIMFLGNTGMGITGIPPEDEVEKDWLSTGQLLLGAYQNDEHLDRTITILKSFENMVDHVDQPDQFLTHLTAYKDARVAEAETRGEYDKIPIEVKYYHGGYLHRSFGFFILAFVVVALSWLSPETLWGRILNIAGFVGGAVGLFYLIYAITLRCIVRSRPPVSTLYETILFITASIVIVALLMELMTRKRMAVVAATFLGFLGVLLAFKFEEKEAVDTMPTLVAVLDTNFWLSTHVTTVTIGYAAGLLAAAMSYGYIFGRLFGVKDKAFRKTITGMVYGIVCFCMFFSLVGTVLGGVWANESWGRFWGWDPKENGAFMIVVWNMMILHGRLGGVIRELGIHICAVIGGIIVAFSWWGVNLLDTGLHSYGFTSGLQGTLNKFYIIQAVVILAGLIVWFMDRAEKSALSRTPREDPPQGEPDIA